jgi:hypothetical protein
VRFTVKHEGLLGLPVLASKVAAYRVSGTATTSGQSVDVYLDMIVLGRGRTICALKRLELSRPRRSKARVATCADLGPAIARRLNV